jgi:hypothetical protein
MNIDAPRPTAPTDSPTGNNSLATAADLGTVASDGLARVTIDGEPDSDFMRTNANVSSWFKFETTRAEEPAIGQIQVYGDSRKIIARLYNQNGNLISTTKGDKFLRFNFRARFAAQTFYLEIAGAPGAFHIFFDNITTLPLPTRTT